MNHSLSKNIFGIPVVYFLTVVIVLASPFFFISGTDEPANSNYETGCNLWKKKEKSELCFQLINHLKGKTALNYFSELYQNDKDFKIGECHIYAHNIGRAAYHEKQLGILGVDNFLRMPKGAGLCAVKLYHGYFQEFFGTPKSKEEAFTEAVQTCDENVGEDESIDSLQREAIHHCYHGIGYGVAHSYAMRYGQREKDIVNAATKDCETLEKAKDNSIFYSCLAGVYEALDWFYLGEASEKLSFNVPINPYQVCQEQERQDLQYPCVIGLRSTIWNTTLDVQKSIEKLKGLKEEIIKPAAEDIMLGAVSFFIKEKNADSAELLGECRKLDAEFHKICLGAVSYRLTMFRNLPSAINFCNNSKITNTERSYCIEKVFDSLNHNYSKEERQTLCYSFLEPNRTACLNLI